MAKNTSYWSVVENRRLHVGRVLQRHVLYLGELNGRQKASWRKSVDLIGQDHAAPQQVALFPDDLAPACSPDNTLPMVSLRRGAMSLRRPRQWGACWLGCELWPQPGLDAFWREHLPPGREGDPLGSGAADSGALSTHRPRLRMAAAPALV